MKIFSLLLLLFRKCSTMYKFFKIISLKYLKFFFIFLFFLFFKINFILLLFFLLFFVFFGYKSQARRSPIKKEAKVKETRRRIRSRRKKNCTYNYNDVIQKCVKAAQYYSNNNNNTKNVFIKRDKQQTYKNKQRNKPLTYILQ